MPYQMWWRKNQLYYCDDLSISSVLKSADKYFEALLSLNLISDEWKLYNWAPESGKHVRSNGEGRGGRLLGVERNSNYCYLNLFIIKKTLMCITIFFCQTFKKSVFHYCKNQFALLSSFCLLNWIGHKSPTSNQYRVRKLLISPFCS